MSETEQKVETPVAAATDEQAPPHAAEAAAAPAQEQAVPADEVEMVPRTYMQPKASTELSEALKNLVVVIDQQLADGWQPEKDLGPIVSASVLDLVPKVIAVKQLGDAITKKPVGSTRALLNSSLDTVAHFTKE